MENSWIAPSIAFVTAVVLVMSGVVFVYLRKYDLDEYKFDAHMDEDRVKRIFEQSRIKEGIGRDKDALDQVHTLKTRLESIETKISFAMQELNKGRRI